MDMMEIELFDPEEQKTYKIRVTEDVYNDIIINDNLELAKKLLAKEQDSQNSYTAAAATSNIDEESAKLWSNQATKLLISLCKKYDKDFETGIKKYIWGKISKEITEKLNHLYTAQQCDTKFKGLKNMYKLVQKHNQQSGNSTKTWEYYDLMDEILFCKPEINARVTCSSKTGLIIHDSNEKNKSNTPENDQTGSGIIGILSETPTSSFSKKRKRAENAIERRHQEKLSRQDRYLDLLERLTKAIEKKSD